MLSFYKNSTFQHYLCTVVQKSTRPNQNPGLLVCLNFILVLSILSFRLGELFQGILIQPLDRPVGEGSGADGPVDLQG